MRKRIVLVCALLCLFVDLPVAFGAEKLWSETGKLKSVEYVGGYVFYFDGLPTDDDFLVREPFDSAMKRFDAQDFAGAVRELDKAFAAVNGVSEHAAIDNLTGWALYKQGLVDSALQSYHNSIDWALAVPDSDAIGAVLAQIGIIYIGQVGPTARDSAFHYLRKALAIHRAISDGTAFANDCSFLEAGFSYLVHQPDSALHYGKQKLLALLAIGNDSLIGGALVCIGNDYRDLNLPGKALENYLEAWHRIQPDYLIEKDIAPLYRQLGREPFVAAGRAVEMNQSDIDALISRIGKY